MLFSNSTLSKIVKYRRPWNSPQYFKEEFFCIKILKFRELFSLYTSHKFPVTERNNTTLPKIARMRNNLSDTFSLIKLTL